MYNSRCNICFKKIICLPNGCKKTLRILRNNETNKKLNPFYEFQFLHLLYLV